MFLFIIYPTFSLLYTCYFDGTVDTARTYLSDRHWKKNVSDKQNAVKSHKLL